MTDMSVGKMAEISGLLYAMSGVAAAAAVVLFFALDIAKCWRMVSGRRFVYQKMRKQNRAVMPDGAKTEQLGRTEVLAGSAETVLLDCTMQEGTVPVDTKALEMIQDIVYMPDTTDIS